MDLIQEDESNRRCYNDLRGVRWRMDMGILPSSSSASIDNLRHHCADSRRRYASLRRQLLVDHHISKDENNIPDLVIDNPLSQRPDSMWGRSFKNAELKRMLDQDLSRLYPEHGSYFQTPECQWMLRRILFLWCLEHPQYGYRQGMHELLAPLLFVLRVDVEYFVEVRKTYEDYFPDRFDGFSFHESDSSYRFDFKKFSDTPEDINGSKKVTGKTKILSDLDPKIQAVVLICDAYGAEGELGTLLSEKFMEHDTYCMFDALMNGANGAVAMAELFSPPPLGSSHNGLSPVLEASASLYHLLSLVDSSVHTHLVELGVEPQYFALRWFRVLFGREFSLEDLLTVWDEIFSCENSKLCRSPVSDTVTSCAVLNSSRGAFILAFSISMILYLRSSLLATENATVCLQRLLNFPEDMNLVKLVEKAKSLQALAMDSNNSIPLHIHSGLYDGSKSTKVRARSLSVDLNSPETPVSKVPDSYWEERWRDLHKEKELNQRIAEQAPHSKIGWSQIVRMRLSRTESVPIRLEVGDIKETPKIRSTLDGANTHKHGSDRSSVASNSAVDENVASFINAGYCGANSENSPLPVPDNPENISLESSDTENSFWGLKMGNEEQKLLSGKLLWLWKFGRHPVEETSEKEGAFEAANACNGVNSQTKSVVDSSESGKSNLSPVTSEGETLDQNTVTLKKLGQSMHENIQVIESVFQQEKSEAGAMESFLNNIQVGKGQVTALAALEELRKISNLLSEMEGDENQ